MIEQREGAYQQFLFYLKQATAQIPSQYMLFPVAGEPNPIYRERVYYYELYHQLRVTTGDDFGYSLGGEVDKSRHPILREFALDKTKPDLLVHRPGDMSGNLIVMEVKPVTARAEHIRKDLCNLTSFVLRGQYYRAIYLIYSGSDAEFASFQKRALRQVQKVPRGQIDLRIIDLFWHRSPDLLAIQMKWDAG
ncbi:MAG: hypothetical protein L0331_13645 [Chloroflexi bacterium]|nr:hypothetical protein [Chloroflexota bacterium]MCI0649403.1 hypothetical protein [Chloroflexota bacterium]